MAIDDMTTRPRDSEGAPGDALAVATVPDSSGTVVAPPHRVRHPFDLSRYEIREWSKGDIKIQVYERPSSYGDRQRQWWYDIRWRGRRIWIEVVGDASTRAEAETAARRHADELRGVVFTVVEGVIEDIYSARAAGLLEDRFDTRDTESTWTPLPDEVQEPRA